MTIDRELSSISMRNVHDKVSVAMIAEDSDLGLTGSLHHSALLSKIESGTVRVGIIGLGYVGLPLARAFAERGIAVLGFDVDPVKVAKLEEVLGRHWRA